MIVVRPEGPWFARRRGHVAVRRPDRVRALAYLAGVPVRVMEAALAGVPHG